MNAQALTEAICAHNFDLMFQLIDQVEISQLDLEAAYDRSYIYLHKILLIRAYRSGKHFLAIREACRRARFLSDHILYSDDRFTIKPDIVPRPFDDHNYDELAAWFIHHSPTSCPARGMIKDELNQVMVVAAGRALITIVNMLVERGADDWDRCLVEVLYESHNVKLLEWVLDHGPTNLESVLKGAKEDHPLVSEEQVTLLEHRLNSGKKTKPAV